MSTPNPLVCGPVQVTWNTIGTVNAITYKSLPLIVAVNQCLQHPFMIQGGIIVIPPALRNLIDDMLNTTMSIPVNEDSRKIFLADKIFEHLTFRTNPPNPTLRCQLWNAVIQQVWAWEDTKEKVHKGTAYYFMAESYLESGDIPSAYICFFNALEDDKRNFPLIQKSIKDAPAYLTTSLIDNQSNFLYPSVVVPLRDSLQRFIYGYNVRTKRNLDMQTIDHNFLQDDSLEDIKRFFVATFHEIYHLSPLNSTRMINNDYSKLKVIDTLFNMGLIIDQILVHRFLQTAPKPQRKMANAVYELALHLGWTTSQITPDYREFLKKANPDPNSGSPDQILTAFLDGISTYDNVTMDARMRAIFTAYHLRNYGGHHLEGSDILVNRYNDVLTTMMDAFFVSIESL